MPQAPSTCTSNEFVAKYLRTKYCQYELGLLQMYCQPLVNICNLPLMEILISISCRYVNSVFLTLPLLNRVQITSLFIMQINGFDGRYLEILGLWISIIARYICLEILGHFRQLLISISVCHVCVLLVQKSYICDPGHYFQKEPT